MKTSVPDLFVKVILFFSCLLVAAQVCVAGSATWKATPANGDWNRPGNWMPRTVPNGPADTASFGQSNQTDLSLPAGVEVDKIMFNAGASAFSVIVPPSLTLTISGAGISNASGVTQSFESTIDAANNHGSIIFTGSASAGTDCVLTADGQVVSGDSEAGIQFSDNSTAGSSTVINNGNLTSGVRGGRTRFLGTSNAGEGNFINRACPIPSSGTGEGATVFLDSSSAGNAVFTNEASTISGAYGGASFFEGISSAGTSTFFQKGASVGGALGGTLNFEGSSTAGSGTFTNEGGTVEDAINGITFFLDSSTAGSATFVNTSGTALNANPGTLSFRDNSTAGDAKLTNMGAALAANSGPTIAYSDESSAGNATITNEGGAASGATGGALILVENATAENATIISNGGNVEGAGGSHIFFFTTSTAGKSTIVLNSGTMSGTSGAEMELLDDSSGGSARLEIFGNAILDISSHNPASITLGSIEGDGLILLGAMTLEVGFNNLSTEFSGVIADGGQGQGVGGILFKEGTGILTLSGANTYTGGTVVDDGFLAITNKSGSATGTGDLAVNQGTLQGTGKISGTITLGSGAGSGAFLAPGVNGPGRLTTQKSLRFAGLSVYLCEIDTKAKRSDSISARGVAILHDTTFALIPRGTRPLPSGTVFTVIDNRSRSAINGTFDNLADGATIVAGANAYTASYEGGDGNDLTLTVQ